ncbi:unnamed protein product [Cylindrotheca closterium]|uniref:Peptidase M11 gametolysin domain-containing protein n=1 Tax=Cylindrotheca closterium TaxID=2856 RepID=A0AAD2FK95_9STRA|nr:unnamed protein product [Cylindrotheca closterium]
MKWNCNGSSITTSISLTAGLLLLLLLQKPTVVQGRAAPPAEVDKPFLTEPCLAVVEEFDYEPNLDISNSQDDASGVASEDESLLYCETPGGYFYKVPTSDPSWVETMVQGGQLISGVTELELPPDTLVNEHLGTLEWKNNNDHDNNSTNTSSSSDTMVVMTPGLVDHGSTNERRTRRRRLAEVTGTKTVLTVRIIATDQQNTFDEATLRQEVFGTDNTNLKTQFDKCSFGQLTFVATDDRSGQTVSIVGGVVTVTVDHSTVEGDSVLRNAVTTKLKQEFGVSSPSDLADHVMYCMPSRAMVGIAYAYINSWLSVYKDVWGLYVSAQMHEIGHNLNLAHSTDLKFLSHDRARSEYDDKTGLMGYSYNDKEFPKMCFNPAKSWQLKWYANKQATYTPTCGEVTMKIGSIIDYDESQVTTVLLQISQTTESLDYYLSYNARALFNHETQEGGNKVVIDAQGGNGDSFSKSTLEARLEVGESFEMIDFNGVAGDTVVLRFLERGGFNSREATISIGWIPKESSICATDAPTNAPFPRMTMGPTRLPTRSPTRIPSAWPTRGPSASPTMRPTTFPTSRPSAQPTRMPSIKPTSRPSITASNSPTTKPSILASDTPTADPTMGPTTLSPTSRPTMEATEKPTRLPSEIPTPNPTFTPSTGPSVSPTSNPSIGPTFGPTFNPTILPTTKPTFNPSLIPTPIPSLSLSDNPSIHPSRVPSSIPTKSPTLLPTMVPSEDPTTNLTDMPTKMPTNNPTLAPTIMPSNSRSQSPTSEPTEDVSNVPTTIPTTSPTDAPTTKVTVPPSDNPTEDPTLKPTPMESDAPTKEPTPQPTILPSGIPTLQPTIAPSDNPTKDPTVTPTAMPSRQPTLLPTAAPSDFPTPFPTPRPSSSMPSREPTNSPSFLPSDNPTKDPTVTPTAMPSRQPTLLPTAAPSDFPTPFPTPRPTSSMPSREPTNSPSFLPTSKPSLNPSLGPTASPTLSPSINPTFKPSMIPTAQPQALVITNPDCRRWYWFMIVECKKNQGIRPQGI